MTKHETCPSTFVQQGNRPCSSGVSLQGEEGLFLVGDTWYRYAILAHQ